MSRGVGNEKDLCPWVVVPYVEYVYLAAGGRGTGAGNARCCFEIWRRFCNVCVSYGRWLFVFLGCFATRGEGMAIAVLWLGLRGVAHVAWRAFFCAIGNKRLMIHDAVSVACDLR